ncbi:hypothetical protein ANTQUA_LOCUS2712 [Anthophora quadrimaculata]
MCTVFKLVTLLLFLSLIVRFSTSKHVDNNNSRANPNAFILLNPKQVNSLEKTIRHLFSKIGEPITGPIVLKSRSPNTYDLQLTIREICDSVRKRLMKFVEDCGLIRTIKKHEQDFSNVTLSEDWYSEILLQSAYLIYDLGNIFNGIGSSIDTYFGEGNATSRRSKQLTSEANSFKFLGVVYDAAEVSEKLAQCLLKMANTRNRRSSIDLNRAILNLANYPPKVVLRNFESSIKSVSYNNALKNRVKQKPWHVFVCLSMIKNEGINYDDCINELLHLDVCLSSVQQKPNDVRNNFDVKSWTKAIRRLSDCKIHSDNNGEMVVSCKTARRMPREIKQKMKYVFERMLDKEISRTSPFHRAADDLGDTLSKSEWGERFVDELCQYVGIYEDGQRKLQRFSKDKGTTARQKEVSEALKTYKKGVLLRTFGAINRIHQSAVDYEKFFAQGFKDTLNEAWQSHVKILSHLMDWMTKLLELHTGEDHSGNGQNSSDTSASQEEWNSDEESNPEDSKEFPLSRSKPEIMMDVDNSMNALMESMNALSRHRSVSNNSMLASIANNLLLVTIFMETIGFISSLYCFGQVGSEQTSHEFEQEWDRRRRSLLPLDYNKFADLISPEYFALDFRENSTVSFLVEK